MLTYISNPASYTNITSEITQTYTGAYRYRKREKEEK